MFTRLTPAACILSSAGLIASLSGCCGHERQTASRYSEERPTTTTAKADTGFRDWPSEAVPGECYAKAYIPPVVQTVSEQMLKREASERVEIVPAQYEWVEERVLVKDASFTLAEVPAQFKTQETTMEVRPAETGWLVNSGTCKTADGKTMNNVYCYVTRPAESRTVSKQVVCKAATVEKIEVPAEYSMVKRNKLVAAATTKKVTVPAEFETVQKTVVSAPARWEWQRVICDHDPLTMNAVKGALIARGYQAGPMNGEMTEQDWASVKAFQLANGLGVGNLSHETLAKLQVSAK